MENINAWTKRLLLGPDKISSRIHSLNLMCAHRSNNFESNAFIKQQVKRNDDDKLIRREYISSLTKTIEPKKTIERYHMYEWIVFMFNDESIRYVNEKDSFYYIKALKTILNKPLSNDVATDKVDYLENCIDNIFHCINNIETTV